VRQLVRGEDRQERERRLHGEQREHEPGMERQRRASVLAMAQERQQRPSPSAIESVSSRAVMNGTTSEKTGCAMAANAPAKASAGRPGSARRSSAHQQGHGDESSVEVRCQPSGRMPQTAWSARQQPDLERRR
jgi:hypothetical protein